MFLFYNRHKISYTTRSLHEKCTLAWEWPRSDCHLIQKLFLKQINELSSFDKCREKCLYKLVFESPDSISAIHIIPHKKYNSTFTFYFHTIDSGCNVNVNNFIFYFKEMFKYLLFHS